MARIRTIKPDFCTSEQVVECSTTARLLFVTMWCFCDDGGNHPASVRRLKMECFPGDSFDENQMEGFVRELLRARLLVAYTAEGKQYWHVSGWKHQKIDKPSYKYPAFTKPDDEPEFDDHSTNGSRTLSDESPAEGKGMEGKGKDLYMSADRGRFEEFWNAFPKIRRTKKQEALRKWKLVTKTVPADLLIQKAAEYAKSPKGQSQYAVMPSVWLNSGMWEDEPAAWSTHPDAATASTYKPPSQRNKDPVAEFEHRRSILVRQAKNDGWSDERLRSAIDAIRKLKEPASA